MKLSLKRPDLNKQTKISYFLLDNHNGLLNFILYIMTCIFVLYLDIQTFWHIMFMWFFFSAKNALLFSSTTVKKSIHPTLFWKDFLNMTLFCSNTTVRSGLGLVFFLQLYIYKPFSSQYIFTYTHSLFYIKTMTGNLLSLG